MAIDQFEELKGKYPHNVYAEALFFNASQKALRLEVPEIGREFTDGLYIGADPEGTLYYRNADSFDDPTRVVKYNVTKYTNPFDNKVCAWVKFYTETIQDCHAEFLAYDPKGTVDAAGMNGYTYTGNWKGLVIGSSTASVRKYDDSKTMTFKAEPLGKTATITDTQDYLKDISVDVQGTLWFKNVSDIPKGKYASYNDDRVVFYADNWTGKDFTAYFVPFESSKNDLGIASANTKIFNVTWS